MVNKKVLDKFIDIKNKIKNNNDDKIQLLKDIKKIAMDLNNIVVDNIEQDKKDDDTLNRTEKSLLKKEIKMIDKKIKLFEKIVNDVDARDIAQQELVNLDIVKMECEKIIGENKDGKKITRKFSTYIPVTNMTDSEFEILKKEAYSLKSKIWYRNKKIKNTFKKLFDLGYREISLHNYMEHWFNLLSEKDLYNNLILNS